MSESEEDKSFDILNNASYQIQSTFPPQQVQKQIEEVRMSESEEDKSSICLLGKVLSRCSPG